MTESAVQPVELPKPPSLLIVVSGPSGVGKDAALRRMRELDYPFYFLVTNTTRPKRPEEVEGVDYHFITREQFVEMEQRGEFLERAVVYGYDYGNSRREVKEALARNAAIREVAVEKARAGALKHRDEDRPVTAEEIESALSDLRRLTEGGIAGGGAGG